MELRFLVALAERFRLLYPEGTRVKLIHMDDKQAPPEGTLGTVVGVDGLASIMVHWDNGSKLSVVYGEDEIQKL